MGSDSSSALPQPCKQSSAIKTSLPPEKVKEVVFKTKPNQKINDKQRPKVRSEIKDVNKSNGPKPQRAKIFQEKAPEPTQLPQRQSIHSQKNTLRESQHPYEAQEEDYESLEAMREAQRLKHSVQFQQLLLMQSQRPKTDQKPFELYLTVDEKWLHNMKMRERDAIDISKVYQQLDQTSLRDSMTELTRFKRVGYDGRKIQMLFKQQVPMLGQFYYQVELRSYIPKQKCEFTVGFVQYYKAQNNAHSRDLCIEQSYTYKQRRDLSIKDDTKPKLINKTIRVEISREDYNPVFAVYINGEDVYKDKLRTEMYEKAISIVPYIQTQYEGVEFGWRAPLAALNS